jgi:hypothetical protein|tara:strand:- start:99 stop:284 length:186 start_codon:yes stop_codon:yes gene_type:complete
MKNKKAIMINKLDVKYREIEYLDNQNDVFNFICGYLDDSQLALCLNYVKLKLKQDKTERLT